MCRFTFVGIMSQRVSDRGVIGTSTRPQQPQKVSKALVGTQLFQVPPKISSCLIIFQPT